MIQIEYALPKAAHVHLEVFDQYGTSIALLIDGWQPAGHQAVQWTPHDVPPGVYYYQIHAGEYIERRTLLLK